MSAVLDAAGWRRRPSGGKLFELLTATRAARLGGGRSALSDLVLDGDTPHLQAVARSSRAGSAPEHRHSFAPDAAEHLVDQLLQIKAGPGEARGEFVEPVQLQIVCASLWDRVRALPEPCAGSKRRTGWSLFPIDRALRDFYDELIDRVAREEAVDRVALRRWCEDALITSGGTRAPAYEGAAMTEGMENAVVERLAAEHLLRGEDRAGGYWYELSHDKFVEPIRTSNRVALEHEMDQVALFSDYVNTRASA